MSTTSCNYSCGRVSTSTRRKPLTGSSVSGMSETRRVTYRGPARSAGILAQFLEEEGVEVSYTPPMEHKGFPEIAETVVVSILCSGAYDVIKAGLKKFRDSAFGRDAEAEIEDEGG